MLDLHRRLAWLLAILTLPIAGASCLVPRISEAELHVARGELEFKRGNYSAAELQFSEALQVDADCVLAYNDRGATRHQRGNLDGAKADFDQAIGRDPDHVVVLVNRGMLLLDLGQPQRAISDLNRAIERNPNYGNAWMLRAIARYVQRDWPLATADFRRYSEIAGWERLYARCWMFLVGCRQGRRRGAEDDLRRVLAEVRDQKKEPLGVEIASFLLGETSESTFLASAVGVDCFSPAARKSTFYFFAGAKRLIGEDPDAAASLLRVAAEAKAWTAPSHTLSRWELEELERTR